MRRLATPLVLLALLLTAAPAASAQVAFQDINTGTVAVRIYNNGIIGDNCLPTTGFAFNGDNGLCGAGFLWGISSSNVIGDAYLLTDATGWTPTSAITTSTAFPYPTLTNGRRTTFASTANNLSVELNAYWGTANPDFVVFRYDITNTGTAAATGYPGNFADWDVGGALYESNVAAADVATSTLSAWLPSGGTPNHFGVTHLTHPMTGWRFSTPYPAAAGVPHLRLDFWEGLTVASGPSAGAQDQRFVQGSGPVTIPAGGTLTFAYAMVAGSSAADFAANVLAARATSTPPPVPSLVSRTQTTGTASLRVFNNGYFGADAGTPADTTFNFGGFAPLYEAQLLAATSAASVIGRPYSNSPQQPSPGFEWAFGPRPYSVAAPAPFTSALMTSYTDAGAGNNSTPIGLSVSQRTLARSGDDFVVVEATVTNTSGAALPALHVGMFADFDVSAAATNDAGDYDAATQTVWTRNLGTGNTNYYGVTLIDATTSGWNVSAETTTDIGLYTGLTAPGAPAPAADDRRMIIGAGPFALAAGASQLVRFAFVGGTNAADLLANAAAARSLFPVGTESGPQDRTSALSFVRPNPTAGDASLTLTADQPQAVRVTLHDALGREVAVLFDGATTGEAQTIRVATAGLPTGVYVVRATGETFTALRRVVVTR